MDSQTRIEVEFTRSEMTRQNKEIQERLLGMAAAVNKIHESLVRLAGITEDLATALNSLDRRVRKMEEEDPWQK